MEIGREEDIVIKITPYFRKNTSTFLALSATILMLLSSPLVFFNLLLQPVHAQTSLSFQTAEPAHSDYDGCLDSDATLTFDAQGTPNPPRLDITNGTFKVTSIRHEQQSYSGKLTGGGFNNNSGGKIESVVLIGSIDNVSNVVNCRIQGDQYSLEAPCSTSNDGVLNPVIIISGISVETNFNGPVECSSSQGAGDTTAQPSSSLTGTTQDGDRGSSSDINRDR